MTSDDLGTAALVMVLVGIGVAVVAATALGWWYLRQPAERRPRALAAVGAGAAVFVVAAVVDSAFDLPEVVGFAWLLLAGAAVAAVLRR